MSNWRINFGVGPVRYTKAIGGRKKAKPAQKEPGCLGMVITVVIVLVLVYLCCWGGVAVMSTQP